MNNQDLDTILLELKRHGNGISVQQLVDENPTVFKKVNDWYSLLNFLKSKNLILTGSNNVRKDDTIHLKPEGLKFINDGGFTTQAKYESDILRYAKQSRNYALWGLIIGIIALLVTIFYSK